MSLSVSLGGSLIGSGWVAGRINWPENYTHVIKADGGYWSASFTIKEDIEKWVQEGLGSDAEVKDDALLTCWRGFVNRVTINYGSLTITRGPLLEIANRVDVTYSGVDTTVLPPIVGVRTRLATLNDTISQASYGIIQKILSPGDVSEADALIVQNTYLEENKFPITSHSWSTQTAAPTSVRLDCLGYVHWLNYPYNQVVNTGLLATDAKILAVIAANPNIIWLPFDTTGIETPVPPANVIRYEDSDTPAWDVIMDAVARGDGNYARWLFGVYGDLKARYQQAPTEIEYTQAVTDPGVKIMTVGANEVKLWNVLPGKWLKFSGLLVGNIESTNLREDPSSMFIETVTYTAPNSLTLQGGKVETLSQILASKGLEGTA